MNHARAWRFPGYTCRYFSHTLQPIISPPPPALKTKQTSPCRQLDLPHPPTHTHTHTHAVSYAAGFLPTFDSKISICSLIFQNNFFQSSQTNTKFNNVIHVHHSFHGSDASIVIFKVRNYWLSSSQKLHTSRNKNKTKSQMNLKKLKADFFFLFSKASVELLIFQVLSRPYTRSFKALKNGCQLSSKLHLNCWTFTDFKGLILITARSV